MTEIPLIRLVVIPKEALNTALRTGEMKEFIRQKKISLGELGKQSGISPDMWKMWIKSKIKVGQAEANEIIGKIRHYEATVMVDQLRESWEAPCYGFPAKQNKTKREIAIEVAIEATRPVASVSCELCVGCGLNGQNIEVLYCPNFEAGTKAPKEVRDLEKTQI